MLMRFVVAASFVTQSSNMQVSTLQGNETSCKQAQQLAKAKAWETEMKKKCKPQKPLIVGCLWHEDATMNTTLKQFAAVLLVDEPIEMDNIGNKGHDTPGSELFGVTNGAHCVPNEGTVQ